MKYKNVNDIIYLRSWNIIPSNNLIKFEVQSKIWSKIKEKVDMESRIIILFKIRQVLRNSQ